MRKSYVGAPNLGEHTREVLLEAGIDAHRVNEMLTQERLSSARTWRVGHDDACLRARSILHVPAKLGRFVGEISTWVPCV